MNRKRGVWARIRYFIPKLVEVNSSNYPFQARRLNVGLTLITPSGKISQTDGNRMTQLRV
jgi:hypothetical protein